MQDEDRQTQEVFDTLTGQQMASRPPRVEDQALSPRSQPGRGLDPVEFARPSFESAVERFRSAGQTDVNPDDPALFNAYRRSMDYLGDMALGGLDLSDAAFRAAVGIVSQALPENQERSFARDVAAMPEAFMGYSPGRIQAAADRVGESVTQVGRNLQQPGPMPALGSNLGNIRPREVPEGALRSFGGSTSGRVTNPLFRSSSRSADFLDDRDGRVLLEYYSPLVSAVEQMPIAREGSTGQNIMAYLNKRAPNVSSQELNYAFPSLEPNTRYTRGEVMELLRPSTRTGFRARVLEGRGRDSSTRYGKDQRQNLRGQEEQDYFEILLENPDSEVNLPSHHDTDTFAHSRGSIREDEQGRYLLIEEIQSDALQNTGISVMGDFDGPEEYVASFQEELFEDTPEEVLLRAFDDILNPRQGESREQARERIRSFYEGYGIDVSGRNIRALHTDAIRKLTPSFNEDPEVNDNNLDSFFDELESTAFDMAEQRRSESYGEGDIPFSNTQYVRQLLLANIARAKEEGIDRVVIPPITEIARLRVGTGNLATLEDAVRALQPTYVDSVRKAVNTINSETQGQIRLGSQPLPYFDLTEPDQTRRASGLLLDISNFEFDPETQAARFAEGGMVDMERQMDLFERGGLTDDGTMRDPVSGNEVPPGSMATEVRDDMPAMLSEGEYIVPADVVRFFGVKFFEDLRRQAKSGLQGMERDGRIGGDPVGMNQDDLSPEELQMLAEISGMYTGGMVQKGYQEGGMVAPPTYSIPGASLFGPPVGGAAGGTTSVTLYGPNCEIVNLTLPTDQQMYNTLLAQGYSTTQPEHCRTTNQQKPSAGDRSDRREDGEGIDISPGGSGTSADRTPRTMDMDEFNAMNEDPVAYGLAALEATGLAGIDARVGAGAGTLLAGPAGMLVGGGLGVANQLTRLSEARAALRVAQERGADTTELEAQIEEFIDDLPNAGRLALELGAATGDNKLERFNETLRQLDPASVETPTPATVPTPTPTATGATTPPARTTPPSSTPTVTPETVTPESQTSDGVDPNYNGEQVSGDRVLTAQDIETLNSAGVGFGDAVPGDRATKAEQDFLVARETQVRSFMGPNTAQTRANRAAAMRPAFPAVGAGTTQAAPTPTQEPPGAIRDGSGNFFVETADGDLRPARPGEIVRDLETGDTVTIPGNLPPAPQVPTQAPTSAQAGLRGGQLAVDRPYVDMPEMEFGTIRPAVSRAPTIPPMPGTAPFASTNTYTPPPLVPNQTVYNPMTGQFEYYDTNYTPSLAPTTPPANASEAYLESYNRLLTGQTPKPSTSLEGLSGQDLLPPLDPYGQTSAIGKTLYTSSPEDLLPPSVSTPETREKTQTSLVTKPTKTTTSRNDDDRSSPFPSYKPPKDDRDSNSSPSKPSYSPPKDDGGTNFSPSRSSNVDANDPRRGSFSTGSSRASTKSNTTRSEPTSRQKAEQAAKDLGVGLATGGRNKGGLVSRPKKKKVAKKK